VFILVIDGTPMARLKCLTCGRVKIPRRRRKLGLDKIYRINKIKDIKKHKHPENPVNPV
jgi:hypothetical protein